MVLFIMYKKTNVKLTIEEFTNRSKIKHGNQYDYSLVEYKNNRTKVKIFHKKCEQYFEQIPYDHMDGRGCTLCFTNKRKSLDEFIEKAKFLYPNNEYDYCQSIYRSSKHKIEIKCNKCDEYFAVVAKDHLRFGHEKCCNNYISKLETKWLNENNILNENRQYSIKLNKKIIHVDGYNPKTNTVYEFLGDFWHGNPNVYNQEKINPINKKTYGELFFETMNRINSIKKQGYNIEYIWEQDYKRKL